MNKLREIAFWLLAPVMAVVMAAPVALAHVAAHILNGRMHPGRRADAERRAPASRPNRISALHSIARSGSLS
jgi:hypothetical protein